MNSFINPAYPLQHRGAERFTSALFAFHGFGAAMRIGRPALGTLLLAGAVAAVVVVADQIVSAWAEDHVVGAGLALWALVFLVMALLADASRGLALRMMDGFDAWTRAAQRRASDERMWAAAQADPRVMADIHAAMLREESAAPATGRSMRQWPFADRSALQRVQPRA